MEESSEQEGEWDRDLGKIIGPRFWQFLGGTGGGWGELEGVDVLGDLEGVWAITEGLLCSVGIRTRSFKILVVCLAKTGSKTWSELSPVWLWLSLLNLPVALLRSTAVATSWQEDADVVELVLLLARLFGREATSCSVLGSTSRSNLLPLTKGKGGRSTGRNVQ